MRVFNLVCFGSLLSVLFVLTVAQQSWAAKSCVGLFGKSAEELQQELTPRENYFRHYLRANMLWPQAAQPMRMYLMGLFMKDPFPTGELMMEPTEKEIMTIAKAVNRAHAAHSVPIYSPLARSPHKNTGKALPIERIINPLKVLSQELAIPPYRIFKFLFEKNNFDVGILTEREYLDLIFHEPKYMNVRLDMEYVGRIFLEIMNSPESISMGREYKIGLSEGMNPNHPRKFIPERGEFEGRFGDMFIVMATERLTGSQFEPIIDILKDILISDSYSQ